MVQQNKDCANVIAFPPLVYAGTLAVGFVVHLLWPIPLFHWTPSRWIGGLLAVISAVIAKWGETALHRAGTHVRPTQPTTAIVQDGPFRFTRNPLYLSLTLLYLGVCLNFNALFPLMLAAPLLLLVHFGIIRREERYLAGKFGEQYNRLPPARSTLALTALSLKLRSVRFSRAQPRDSVAGT